MHSVAIKVSWLDDADRDVALPFYESDRAAGADVRANFAPELRDGIMIEAGGRALVPTGIRVEIPMGYEVQVRPRSGLALKHGLTLPNTPGTIDSDYRGPLGVIVLNTGAEPFHVTHGMRIAQLIVAPVVQGNFLVSEELSNTKRGEGGFGSTGVS
ncbi:dUTP diphosphatase, partial [Roseobacter sp.]|uniref:dUTP diphosphatase n=1 Tax=Roseobacter sp. TaxID=1907202 RepID=UPI003296D218